MSRLTAPIGLDMARIEKPQSGQMIWTVTNGEVCQRIYVGPSKLYNGHVLEVPGYPGQATYYVDHLFAYEQESDILLLHLQSAREAVLQAQQRLASLELRYQETLMKERFETKASSAEVETHD